MFRLYEDGLSELLGDISPLSLTVKQYVQLSAHIQRHSHQICGNYVFFSESRIMNVRELINREVIKPRSIQVADTLADCYYIFIVCH